MTATVTNTGSRAGTEVAQLYVGDSSRNLPLTGNLNNPSTVTANSMS